MRKRSPVLSLFAFGVLGLGAFGARTAYADNTCAKDADCVKGWACQVTGGSGCANACAPGEVCPPADCPVQDTKSCVPGPCTADSDCATGMVCYTEHVGCDSVPPCAGAKDCAEPACTPTTKSACIPSYEAPCKADADCGSGFRCVANQNACACASAGSAPDADGGSAPPPPVDCSCPPSTSSSCQTVPVVCASAADCAAGWTCETVGSTSTCAGAPTEPPTPGAKDSADGGAPKPAEDAGVDPCPPPPPATKQCMPPYYSLVGGSLGVGSGSDQSGTPTSGSSGSSGSNAPGANSGTPPKTSNEGDASSQTSTAAGCSVARGNSGGAAGLALLTLGLFGFLRRRRASCERAEPQG